MNADAILHFWFTKLTAKQHFAKDAALDALIAQELVWRGDAAQLSAPQRRFAYMPYMPSESVRIHQEALRLIQK